MKGYILNREMIDGACALFSLAPNAEYSCKSGGEILEWHSTDITQPSQPEIDAEVIRLQAEYDSQQYARDRQPEYPPVTDYLDGIVKGDTAQVDKYVADCLAVKVKYPKP